MLSENLLEIFTKQTLNEATIPILPWRVPPDKNRYGVELEVEGSRLPSAILGWDTHSEGSLRGSGIEYVTHGPVSREQLLFLMKDLTSAFQKNKTLVSESFRTSTHIHRNMSHRSIDQILRAMIHFACFEALLLSLCGASRNGNLFCLTSFDGGDFPGWLERWFKNQQAARQYNPGRWDRGKYSSLNSNPLGTLGSLEARVFPGSVNEEEILKWCDWIEGLIGKEFLHPSEMITGIWEEPITAAKTIFGEQMGLSDDKITTLVRHGCESSWPTAAVYQKWMG